MNRSPTLTLITGHTGAGKSTIAKKMAAHLPAFYLSHDELLVKAYGNNIETLDFADCCKRMDTLIWTQAKQLHNLGIDLVLEGFGTKPMRDGVRKEAARIGYQFKLVWVECPAEIRLKRVLQRNQNLNDEGYLFTEEEFWRIELMNEDLDAAEIAEIVNNSSPI